MIDIRFEAAVVPKAWARPRARYNAQLGRAQAFESRESAGWKAQFAAIAEPFCPSTPIDEPVCLDLVCILPRPTSRSRKKDAPGLLWCGSRPDADNFAKNVLDALKAFWVDDARVSHLRVMKVYAEEGRGPRLMVRIRSFDGLIPEQEVARTVGLSLPLHTAFVEPTERDLEEMRAANAAKDAHEAEMAAYAMGLSPRPPPPTHAGVPSAAARAVSAAKARRR